MTDRIHFIDAVKGFAILLVVLGHIIDKMTVVGNSKYMLIVFEFIYSFHMPLFLILSGYVYGKISVKKIENKKIFIENKAIGLLIPYIIFSVLVCGLKILAGSENTIEPIGINDLLNIFFIPLGYLWYIYVLFLLYCAVILTDKISLKIIIIICSILHFISYYLSGKNILSIFLGQAVFFFIGIGISKSDNFLYENKIKIISAVVFFITEIYVLIENNNGIVELILKIICAISASIFISSLFAMKYKNNDNKSQSALQKFGKRSIYIYLLHQPIISVFRTILMKLHITNVFFWFITMAFGTFMSVYFVCCIANRIKWIDFIFVPNKYLKVKK